MASKRQRNRALKRKQKVNVSDLAPKIAAGLTQGASAREALSEFPVMGTPGVSAISHMRAADERLKRDGLPYAPFVAENSTSAVWTDGVTDRVQMDYTKTYTEAGMRLLREGRQCLRCDEPHPDPFPTLCDVCGYPMRDRQIMDIAMEFQGEKHLGPRQPISQFMEEQEARVEKRKFIRRVLDGHSGKVPREWLADASLLEGLSPSDVAAIQGSK